MKKFFPFLFVLPTFAFAQEAAPGAQSGMMQTIIMIGLAMVFFYFILWRPEQKRRKAAEQMRTGLKKGDKVTAMGIIGTVARVQDQTIILQVDGAKIEILKAAITDVQASSHHAEEETAGKS